jgi:hypothetical protein
MHLLIENFNLADRAGILVIVDMVEISNRVGKANLLTYANDAEIFTHADMVKVFTHIYKGKI